MANEYRETVSDKLADKILVESRLNRAGFVMAAHHCHPYFEIFNVESGACSFFIGNNMFDLHEGDFILIPPDVFHYTRYLYGACRRNNIFFRRENISDATAKLMPHGGEFFLSTRIFQTPEAYRGQMSALIARMVREEKINDERSALMLEALLQQLLLLCSRECTFLSDMPADIHTTDRPIVEAARFISENYTDDISAKDIADAAGYSPNYLSKKFREATGIGVHEYLVFIRLQRAALELLSTDNSITEIAARCGFSDANYFKDAFKKKYGVTPRAYRSGGEPPLPYSADSL